MRRQEDQNYQAKRAGIKHGGDYMGKKTLYMALVLIAIIVCLSFELDSVEGKDPEWTLDHNNGGGKLVDISEDGELIITGGKDADDFYLYANDGTKKWKYDGDANKVNMNEIAISRDGEYIVVGCDPIVKLSSSRKI